MGIQINGNTDNISATDGGLTVSDLEINQSGISTFNNALNIGTGSSIFSPATNTLTLGTNSAERLRIASDGVITGSSCTMKMHSISWRYGINTNLTIRFYAKSFITSSFD